MAASKAANRKSRSSASDRTVRDSAVPHDVDRVWQRAMRLLAAHDRSEAEMRSRLTGAEATSAVVDGVVQRLYALHYLDDRRFAAGAAEAAHRRGRGSEYVRAQLTAKGVAEELIDEAVDAAFTNETQLARLVLATRYRAEPQRPAERAKAARFLSQRGFPEAVVLAILGEGC